MKKWYKQPYFNRRAWILENFDKLSLNSEEVVLLMLIDFAKENKKTVNYDYLMSKMGISDKEVDKLVAKLVSKKYLAIVPTKTGISFDIDSLFEFDPEKFEITSNSDVFTMAEDLLSRPLSPNELQKLSDLLNTYTANQIIDAIRTAEAYRKTSINYVESVLRNAKK